MSMAETALPIPKHVAVIMDGNGRWAMNRGAPRHWGHREGSKSVRAVVRGCRALGVGYLTLYAFSLANWARPRVEVTALMRLLVRFARREVAELREKGISVGTIGRIEDLPPVTRRAIDQLMDQTKDGKDMRLTLALSYSGRYDVARAARQAAELVAQGKLRPEEVDDKWIRSHLWTAELPDPDLVIRTGGEQRSSDFLPYESVYSEFHYPPELWPDFSEDHLKAAIQWYQSRERRFGKTSAQVRGQMPA
ncbi:MAG: di-trans,poly-cis-decaprenylcistransferase [Deltaproteobacteria bacterium]|nr:di-trans,poly-cis-decaprenylcistransferase [Deltaproteobacteria bacterium]